MEIHLKPKENPSLIERFISEIRHALDSIVVEYLHLTLEHFFYLLRCFSSSQWSHSPRSFNCPQTLFLLEIYPKANFYFASLRVKRMMSAIESGRFKSLSKWPLGRLTQFNRVKNDA
ncbi:hypothetical protein OQJ26_14165 [Legionella sp. PATHC038]|uniref:hypothetical protein n=1 Tax=Legionella sheltonii TaxID=2992041 RepID=UPI00224431A3|nr:hypothetical protein [Legionella sp. PATHC038]MCW8399934.1 hypothetical protein [Legionella sp. PATHC038]